MALAMMRASLLRYGEVALVGGLDRPSGCLLRGDMLQVDALLQQVSDAWGAHWADLFRSEVVGDWQAILVAYRADFDGPVEDSDLQLAVSVLPASLELVRVHAGLPPLPLEPLTLPSRLVALLAAVPSVPLGSSPALAAGAL
jgi:hypothetical protein